MSIGLRRRRVSAAAAGLLSAALVLTACGGSDSSASSEPEQSTESSSSLVPEGEGTTQYPLTIDTFAGDYVLEQRPERVAVIGFSASWDGLEAIGVTPVYIDSPEAYLWNDSEWVENIEVKDPAGYPYNLEAIASTNPDLIIAINAVAGNESDIDALSDIAPVLETPEPADSDKFDWRQSQRLIGEALDLQAAAETAISDADTAVADAAAANPEFAGKTATIAYDYGEYGFDFYNPSGSTTEGIVTSLGFEPSPNAERFAADAVISDENQGLLDADVLVVFYDDEASREKRESSDLFKTIPAVAEGRYTPVVITGENEGDDAVWVLRRGASTVSLPWAAEYIATWLTPQGQA